MRIKEQITGHERSELCSIVRVQTQALQASLETVIIETSLELSASKQLKSFMFNQLVAEGWRSHFKISKDVSEVYPLANYVLDAMQDVTSNECNHTHRFLVEFCFDNRQAIGSNILKFEVASRVAIQSNYQPVPILVCAELEVLKDYGWDGSIASSAEYEYALRVLYRDLVQYPPIIFALCR